MRNLFSHIHFRSLDWYLFGFFFFFNSFLFHCFRLDIFLFFDFHFCFNFILFFFFWVLGLNFFRLFLAYFKNLRLCNFFFLFGDIDGTFELNCLKFIFQLFQSSFSIIFAPKMQRYKLAILFCIIFVKIILDGFDDIVNFVSLFKFKANSVLER